MFLYRITNKINNKKYIGITNDYKKRWSNHKCNKKMVIGKAIQKYGAENFIFEVLFSNLSLEKASELEQKYIEKENTLVPNGYNIAKGGMDFIQPELKKQYGGNNGKAVLTNEEAQYIKDNRNIPEYVLYEEFSDRISYSAFKDVYLDKTYKNIKTSTPIYPFNSEFSNQFTSQNRLTYNEVVQLREMYAEGIDWEQAFKLYEDRFKDKWSFWNIYYGNKYKLVMPEVFSEENRKKHSQIKNNKKAGSNNGRAKLTEKDVLNIRKLHSEGVNNSEIYQLYPQISTTSVRNIINRKTWTNI